MKFAMTLLAVVFLNASARAEIYRVELPLDVVSVIETKPSEKVREVTTRVGWKADRSEGVTATLTQVLDFGLGAGGDREKILGPLDKGAAQIQLTGKPGRTVRITLPPGVEMESECQCGYIIAEYFTSDWPANEIVLDERGQARIRIGATREALPFNLKSDRYRGKTKVVFSVDDSR